jgi:uncharacterized protein (TIGR03435 family)
MLRLTASLVFSAAALAAQTSAASLAFEVASVRASQTGRAGGEGSRRERVEAKPGSLIMTNVRFASAMKWAYSIQDYQINGPGWVTEERYDIVAKAASAAPENQLRSMLQTLLAERFNLSFHRLRKEMSAYVVLIGRNGHKMKQSDTEGLTDMRPNGKMGAVVRRADLDELAGLLSQPLRAPVINMTGLTGRYDFTIDVTPYITPEVMSQSKSDDVIIPIAMTAIQEQLGLKLESRKVQVEIFMIDHAEKTPIEN